MSEEETQEEREYQQLMNCQDMKKLAKGGRDFLKEYVTERDGGAALSCMDDVLQRIEALAHQAEESDDVPLFFQTGQLCLFVHKAYLHYHSQKAPQWMLNYLDELYIRLGENGWKTITLDEIYTLQTLYNLEFKEWQHQLLASKIIYTLFHRLGRDTSTIIPA
jgi:hypothetical protein